MESKKAEKLVRFYHDGKTDPRFPCVTNETRQHLEKPLTVYKVSGPSLLKTDGGGVADGNSINIVKFGKFKVFQENHEPWQQRILDPGSDIFLLWKRVFLIFCLVALFLDPLFFYLPSVQNFDTSSCLETDLNLTIALTCFRTLVDVFYLLHMGIKFRTAYVSPSSRVFGKGELVMDPKLIARRYLRSDFFIDLIATLPLPQILIWFAMPASSSSHSDHANNALVLIVLLQYVPRLYLMFPLSSEIIEATGVVTKTAWGGAAYNLLLYVLASHFIGASWYMLSVERYATCWKSICREELSPVKCFAKYLNCDTLDDGDRQKWINGTSVFTNCTGGDSTTFNYGIFGNAVTNNVASTVFIDKYFFCLWWGLQQLSSYGQNLTATTFIGETSFTILIVSLGLVLFAHLIGNMQTYLQSITVRVEEWRLKRRDTEEWMQHRQLPQNLRERVRRFVQYKWVATRGVDEESILRGLPKDLRRDIQGHLCLNLIKRVPFFAQMDDQLLDAICERLVSCLSAQGACIVREGDPVTEMLFIIRGTLESSTTNGGRTDFFNSITLRPGDFCGEELLSWALLPISTLNLPSSTRTVRSLDEVEAFALRAEDLKFFANQFRRLHSKKLQHTFRFYSYQWRTWAACFIQAAWRRYKKRMMVQSLSMAESSYTLDPQLPGEMEREEQDEDTNSLPSLQARQNLGVRIITAMFAANARRGAQNINDVEMPKLQKPDEPDFSMAPNDE